MSAESTRTLLTQLARNVVACKRDADVIASEIVGWVAATDLYESQFASLVEAVRAGDLSAQERLLSVLVGEQVAA